MRRGAGGRGGAGGVHLVVIRPEDVLHLLNPFLAPAQHLSRDVAEFVLVLRCEPVDALLDLAVDLSAEVAEFVLVLSDGASGGRLHPRVDGDR